MTPDWQHPSSARLRGSFTLPAARVAGGAAVLVWALHFYWPALRAQFAPDDMMNIAYYWDRGAAKLVENLLLFFTTFSRPMGGVYFLGLYSRFGLNPLPYHIALIALLLFNTWLVYRFGRLLSGSDLTGGIAALATAYHARMPQLVFLPAFVFDVLCFTFYFLALNCYLAARTRGDRLSPRRIGLLLLFYVAALDSKEMAVTLPAVLLAYELLFHWPARWGPAAVLAWLRTEALPVLITSGVTLVYIVGKTTGPDSLVQLAPYQQHFRWSRYVESTWRFMQTILYLPAHAPSFQPFVPVVWVFAAILCWWIGKRYLWWLLAFMVLSPLPITFLDTPRGEATLYITLAGWAAFLASLLTALAGRVAALPLARRAPTLAVALVALLAARSFYGLVSHRNAGVPAHMMVVCAPTWSVIEDLRRINFKPKPGSRIYFTNDIFGGYDSYFIVRLLGDDPTLDVHLGSKRQLSDAEVARMDYVFAYDHGRVKLIKSP